MPPQHRLGLHDHQSSTPLAPSLGEEDPEESVSPAELWALDRSGQCRQLLPEREILEGDSPVSAAQQPIDRRSTTSAVSIRNLVVQSTTKSSGRTGDRVMANHRFDARRLAVPGTMTGTLGPRRSQS